MASTCFFQDVAWFMNGLQSSSCTSDITFKNDCFSIPTSLLGPTLSQAKEIKNIVANMPCQHRLPHFFDITNVSKTTSWYLLDDRHKIATTCLIMSYAHWYCSSATCFFNVFGTWAPFAIKITPMTWTGQSKLLLKNVICTGKNAPGWNQWWKSQAIWKKLSSSTIGTAIESFFLAPAPTPSFIPFSNNSWQLRFGSMVAIHTSLSFAAASKGYLMGLDFFFFLLLFSLGCIHFALLDHQCHLLFATFHK